MTNASANRPRFVRGSGGSRPTGEKARDRRGTLRRLADYLQPYHARLLLVAALVVVATALGLAGPALLGRAIDAYVLHDDIDGLALMAAALQDAVSVGVIAAFVVYIMNFFRPMRGIAMVYNQLQSALAGAERIFAVLDETPSVVDAPDALPLRDIRGAVSFDSVSFAYQPGELVLSDISLDVQPGQTIALVGPTGAGKTTIISLLSRFYDVSAGCICIDGADIRDLTQDSIRAQLGIVLQDTFLFSGTVMENIRYGRLDATDDEVIEAARLANADGFIHLLPRDYQTQVSERGHNFSQGQRQLLAIARAILADPRILILDEATSSVHTRTEIHIQEALLRLLEGRTAFVIAHRLSTIRNADQVLVINDQRIIERGTHDQLLGMGGFYAQLYHSQHQRIEEMAEV